MRTRVREIDPHRTSLPVDGYSGTPEGVPDAFLDLAALAHAVEPPLAGAIISFQTEFRLRSGGVALIGRAHALHAGGWRFESARLHQMLLEGRIRRLQPAVRGSSLTEIAAGTTIRA
jgi:hypothetical protein